jgi:hypothetical protein
VKFGQERGDNDKDCNDIKKLLLNQVDYRYLCTNVTVVHILLDILKDKTKKDRFRVLWPSFRI